MTCPTMTVATRIVARQRGLSSLIAAGRMTTHARANGGLLLRGQNSLTAQMIKMSSSLSTVADTSSARASAAITNGMVDCGGDETHWSSSKFATAAALLGTGLLLSRQDEYQKKADCCAVAGVVSGGNNKRDAREFLVEGLTILKNRGYDSAGLATITKNDKPSMVVTKFSSDNEKGDCIDLVEEHSQASAGHSIGIAHTRWATHGGKTDENAHPHTDSSGKIALVHNGTLNNSNELRRELQGLGHVFSSQTDTEVIVKLIGHYRDEDKSTVKEATEKALDRCDGTWGLCIMCTDTPDELIVACNGSPLVIGLSDDRTFVASETSAFNRYTKNFISMKDGEIGVLHADGRGLDLSRIRQAPDEEIKLSPEPFPNWTIKEITEQPAALSRALGFGGRLSFDEVRLGGLDDNFDRVSKIKHLILAGCSSSLHAANYGERLMKQLGTLCSVSCMDAQDIDSKDFPSQSNLTKAGLVAISQSGETTDVYNVVSSALDEGLTVISVVNDVGSLIARTTKLGVYCSAGRENAVASTKTFTSQVTVLALIALWFRQAHDKLKGRSEPSVETMRLREALMRLPITFGMAMNTRDQCREIAKQLVNKEHCFVLGKGYGEPIAMEGALKLKEFSYLHAEGYSGGALKHGPFALIEDESGKFGATPIIMLILDDQHAHHMRTAAEEVKARGAQVIIITDKPSLARDLDENPIVIPTNGPMTALGAVLPMQLIAYELAILKGINPDTPKNLAKVFRPNQPYPSEE